MLPLLLFLFTFISLYPLTKMFFVRDDFMILYKLQQNLPIGYPYDHLLTFYKPIYNIFDLNAYFYYLLGLIAFSISVVFLFHFLRKISNPTVAFFTTLLYATGLIALENLIMMVYVAPIPLLVITATSILILFLKFTETGKKQYYIFSLFLYAFALVFFAYRAHLLYAYVLFVDVFFVITKDFSSGKKIKAIIYFIARQLPYFLIFFNWFSPSGTATASKESSYYLNLLNLPARENIIINFTNLFIQPLNINNPDFQIFDSSQKVTVGLIILLFSIVIGIYGYLKGYKQYARLLIFALLMSFANLLAYFFFNPDFRIQAMSRYNFFNTISFNLYIVTLFLLIRNLTSIKIVKNAILAILIGIFLLFFSASFTYVKTFNQTRSEPAKQFYSRLKKFMPTIPKGAIIYLDRKETLPFDPSEIVRVGRLPTEASFASMYKIPIGNITYTKFFDEVEKKFKENPTSVDHIFAFYLTENGLTDTTKEVRKGLVSQNEFNIQSSLWKESNEELSIVDCGDYTVGIPPVIQAGNLSIPSYTPIKTSLQIRVQPLDLSGIKYPYYQIKGSLLDIKSLKQTPRNDLCSMIKDSAINQNYSAHDVLQYILYLKRYKELTKNIEITGSKTLPEDPLKNLIDNDLRTFWTADIHSWAGINKANIIMKFPSRITVGKLIIVPANSQRLPKTFTISTLSEDGNTWEVIKTVKNAAMEEEVWYEATLPSTSTSSIQLEITDTDTGLYPQLSELYIVEDKWKDINIESLKAFKENQFLFIPNQESAFELLSYTLGNDEAAIYWKRDKDDNLSKNNYVKFAIYPDGNLHTYTVTIPAGGARLEKLRLEGFNLPSTISILNGE